MTTPINPVTLITGTVLLSLLSTVQAEVITDGTVGQGPPRLVEGPNYQISDDLGAKNYTNLYHSFDKFNINTGETATFTGPQNITNVFGRVTGGSGSVIDGQIRSEMPMADIYLINPNGILFGENASLDVPGSFYASTANQIILKDGTEFSATHPQNHPPTLSAAPFEAFGFLDHNQATLSVNGSSLEVSDGETLALTGRHVQLENAEISSGGQIHIDTNKSATGDISVANSKIAVITEGEGRVFFRGGKLVVEKSAIQMDSKSANSQIEIDTTAMQLTDNSRISLRASTTEAGKVVIGTGHLDMLELNNSAIRTNTYGAGNAGEVFLTAQKINMSNGSDITAQTSSSGNAGDVFLEAQEIEISNGSEINTQTSGAGNAGRLRIIAEKQLRLSNSKIKTDTLDGSDGKGGRIAIQTPSLEGVGATISAEHRGNNTKTRANISLSGVSSAEAQEINFTNSSIRAESFGVGPGGHLDISTNALKLTNSQIQAGTTGAGTGGEVRIQAANSVTISEESGVFVAALGQKEGSGEAGVLEINTGRLSVTNSTLAAGTIGAGKGGEVKIKASDSITLSGNSSHEIAGTPLYAITVDTRSTSQSGNAQTAYIETPRLTMTNGATISAATFGPGDAGDLTINANEISLNESSHIQAATLSRGKGGSVNINTDRLEVTDSSLVVGTTGSGKGGELQIKATDSITLSGNSSHNIGGAPLYAIAVDTRSTAQSGNAQTAYIETPRLTMTNGATMSAATFGPGDAGDFTINANEIRLNQNSLIQAATFKSGNAGSLGINTGTLEIKDSSIAMGTVGSGKGGDLQIKATDSIKLSGESSIRTSNERVTNGIPLFSITVDSRSSGDATSTGEPIRIQTPNLTLENGAAISVATFGSGKGGNLEIEAENISVENSNIVATTLGSGEGGSIDILTSNLELSGTTNNSFLKNYQVSTIDVSTRGTQTDSGNSGRLTIGPSSEKRPTLKIRDGASMSSATFGHGQGGDIRLDVNTLTLTNGGQISSSSSAEGQAGNIAITASEYLNIFGNNSGIFSTSGEENNTQATGNAGQITLGEQTKSVPTLRLDDGGKISTTAYGTGDSGTIELFVDDLQITEGSITSVSQTGRYGANPANITIDVNKLTLGDKEGKRGYIESSTEGVSAAGKITITASEYIKIYTNSGIFSTAEEGATEKAGQIIIGSNSNPVNSFILEGGEINTTTWDLGQGGEIDLNVNTLEITQGGRIESSTESKGHAGTITITASEDLKIVGDTSNNAETSSGIFSETNSTEATAGNAGTITINMPTSGTAHSALLLTKNGRISTTTLGTGQGGEIDLNVNTLEITQGGRIESSTESKGHAGTITITASEDLKIVGDTSNNAETSSGIFSETNSTEATAGNAGTITINMPTSGTAHPALLLTKNGRISTTTLGTGQGGEIALNLNTLEITEGGRIESSTRSEGHAGTITITASENIKIVGDNSNRAETTSGIFSETNSTEATAGNAGTITIDMPTSGTDDPALLLTKNGRISTITSGTGQGGEIALNLNSLEISEGGRIESSTTDAGSAGKITITASEYINIWGGKILSTALKTGNAGEITIEAGNHQFGETKDIREFIDNPDDIEQLPFILAEEGGLSLQNGGKISTSTQGKGEGGKIQITTSQLELKTQASISATSEQAAAGNIVIGTNQLNMSGSTISTSSAASKGGEILIGVRKVNNKRIINSTLSAKAGERGDGGNLLIRGKPEYLILDNTDLIAKAEQGDGGEIAVDANVFIASGDSEVSASSNKGIDGEVNIDSAQIDVESINLLPSRPVDASKLIKDCVASDSEEEWSLVQVGYKVTTFQNRTGCRSQ
jgi:filamentous hemagglutinin family protein